MLTFMRKHQKYFYVVITIVVIASFSFFGTYGTLNGNSFHEQIAFTTVAGQEISRGELEEMSYFIATDAQDKLLFGGAWGPNFLNDGVIRNDLLSTGLAQQLMASYPEAIASELQSRYAKEKRYKPYTHPGAPYLSSVSAWSYFAPEIPRQLALLQNAGNPLSGEALDARAQLFLNERKFPSYYLMQVLKYQEKQNRSLTPDPNLGREDLSLFGYHTIEDWFGNRFVRLMAEFIFNAAAIAEQKGFTVTRDEALADLYRNAELSFKDNSQNPSFNIASAGEYFDQQLVRMRLDRTKAANLWQKVLLFRRLFSGIGQSVFVDPFAYNSFNSFSNEAVQGSLYTLPQELWVQDFRTLLKLEAYLAAVTKRTKEERANLIPPQTFLTVSEVMKKNPELVRKRYQLEISSINKRDLQAKVGVRETLSWELEEANWNKLKTAFPELGLKKSATKEEKLAALDALDVATKARVEQFARAAIVDSHPEWIKERLDQAPSKAEWVSLAVKGPNALFKGLDKGETLMKELDDKGAVDSISFNGDQYYRIKVLDKKPDFEILPFAEANQSPILDALVDNTLEPFYVEIRGQSPSAYQKPDKSWKPLAEVRTEVGATYHDKLLKNIKDSLLKRPDGDKYKALEGERLASYRFEAYLTSVLAEIQADKEAEKNLIREQNSEISSVQDQFKIVKSPLNLTRSDASELPEGNTLFNMKPKTFSKVAAAPNGALYFAYIEDKVQEEAPIEVKREQTARARFLLGGAAERTYLDQLLPQLKEKNAISFDYLQSGEPSIEPES